jgi:hypothetical protein
MLRRRIFFQSTLRLEISGDKVSFRRTFTKNPLSQLRKAAIKKDRQLKRRSTAARITLRYAAYSTLGEC